VTRLRSAPTALLAALAVVVGGLAAACSSSTVGGAAITVDGTSLSNKDFQDRLEAIQNDPTYFNAAITDAQGQPLDLTGQSPGTYSTDFVTQVLNQQVSFTLARQELDRRGITVSDDDRARAEQLLANELGQAAASSSPSTDQASASGQSALDDLGDFKGVLIGGVADILALQDAFAQELSTDDQLRAYYDANTDSFKGQACTSVLLAIAGSGPTRDPSTGAIVPPPDADYPAALTRANDLADQWRSGAEVATLAAQADNAQIGVNDGDLGCQALGTYGQQVPELDAAIAAQPVGQVGSPVRTDYGYFVVLVRARGDLSFDEAKAEIQKGVQSRARQQYQQWVVQAAKDADVTVDPQYGSWDSQQGTVVAPEGATSTSTTSTTTSDQSTLTPDQLGQLGGGSSTTTSP
jgi:hypothetical protein